MSSASFCKAMLTCHIKTEERSHGEELGIGDEIETEVVSIRVVPERSTRSRRRKGAEESDDDDEIFATCPTGTQDDSFFTCREGSQ